MVPDVPDELSTGSPFPILEAGSSGEASSVCQFQDLLVEGVKEGVAHLDKLVKNALFAL